jgi:hypothetical protein
LLKNNPATAKFDGIFGINKSTLPQVIATTAPPALVRQQQAVEQQLQAPRTTGTIPPTPTFPPDLIKVIANIKKLTCPKPQPPEFFFELHSSQNGTILSAILIKILPDLMMF